MRRPRFDAVVQQCGSTVFGARYKEKFIFEKEHLKSEKQIQIADELNTLITNSLGTNEDTLQTKRFIVISLKAKNFIEANALFLNIFLKTEQKFKELKSKVNLITSAFDFVLNTSRTGKTLNSFFSISKP